MISMKLNISIACSCLASVYRSLDLMGASLSRRNLLGYWAFFLLRLSAVFPSRFRVFTSWSFCFMRAAIVHLGFSTNSRNTLALMTWLSLRLIIWALLILRILMLLTRLFPSFRFFRRASGLNATDNWLLSFTFTWDFLTHLRSLLLLVTLLSWLRIFSLRLTSTFCLFSMTSYLIILAMLACPKLTSILLRISGPLRSSRVINLFLTSFIRLTFTSMTIAASTVCSLLSISSVSWPKNTIITAISDNVITPRTWLIAALSRSSFASSYISDISIATSSWLFKIHVGLDSSMSVDGENLRTEGAEEESAEDQSLEFYHLEFLFIRFLRECSI